MPLTEPSQAAWDVYWQELQKSGYVNYTPELLRALEAVTNLPGQRVLEIGGGTGGNSSLLARKGAEVYVLDFSPTALSIAAQTAEQAGVRFRLLEADARHIPFPDGFFDLIFHQGFLEHFRHPLPLLLEQRRVLREGGYLLVDVPQTFNLFTVKKHLLMAMDRWEYGWEREFSYGSLCQLLIEAGFEVVEAYGRGYYPRPFHMLRHLRKIEERLGRSGLLPGRFWECYESPWRRFEAGRAALYLLQCIGVVGRK